MMVLLQTDSFLDPRLPNESRSCPTERRDADSLGKANPAASALGGK